MRQRVRATVGIASALLVAAAATALWVASGEAPDRRSSAREMPMAATASRHTRAPLVVPEERGVVSEGATSLASGAAGSVAAHGSVAEREPEIGSRPPERADSKLEAEISVLEAEAARLVGSETPRLAPREPLPLPQDPERRARAERAEQRRLADALLEEHLAASFYEGVEFPPGFPAEFRARAFARGLIAGMSPEQRAGALAAALASAREARPEPFFQSEDHAEAWAGGPL